MSFSIEPTPSRGIDPRLPSSDGDKERKEIIGLIKNSAYLNPQYLAKQINATSSDYYQEIAKVLLLRSKDSDYSDYVLDTLWYSQNTALVTKYFNQITTRDLLTVITSFLEYKHKNPGVDTLSLQKAMISAIPDERIKTLSFESLEGFVDTLCLDDDHSPAASSSSSAHAAGISLDELAQQGLEEFIGNTDIPVTVRGFSNLLLDKYLRDHMEADGGTEVMEGWHISEAYPIYIDYLKLAFPDPRPSQVELLIKRLEEMLAWEVKWDYVDPSETDEKVLCDGFIRIIEEMKDSLLEKGEIWLSGGWLADCIGWIGSGHAMVYHIAKESGKETYQFKIYNTGSGIQHHEYLDAGLKKKINPVYTVVGVSEDVIREGTFLRELMELRAWDQKAYKCQNRTSSECIDKIYRKLVLLTKGTPLVDPSRTTEQIYTDRQVSGTCVAQVLYAFCLEQIGDRKLYYRFKHRLGVGVITSIMKQKAGIEDKIKAAISIKIKEAVRLYQDGYLSQGDFFKTIAIYCKYNKELSVEVTAATAAIDDFEMLKWKPIRTQFVREKLHQLVKIAEPAMSLGGAASSSSSATHASSRLVEEKPLTSNILIPAKVISQLQNGKTLVEGLTAALRNIGPAHSSQEIREYHVWKYLFSRGRHSSGTGAAEMGNRELFLREVIRALPPLLIPRGKKNQWDEIAPDKIVETMELLLRLIQHTANAGDLTGMIYAEYLYAVMDRLVRRDFSLRGEGDLLEPYHFNGNEFLSVVNQCWETVPAVSDPFARYCLIQLISHQKTIGKKKNLFRLKDGTHIKIDQSALDQDPYYMFTRSLLRKRGISSVSAGHYPKLFLSLDELIPPSLLAVWKAYLTKIEPKVKITKTFYVSDFTNWRPSQGSSVKVTPISYQELIDDKLSKHFNMTLAELSIPERRSTIPLKTRAIENQHVTECKMKSYFGEGWDQKSASHMVADFNIALEMIDLRVPTSIDFILRYKERILKTSDWKPITTLLLAACPRSEVGRSFLEYEYFFVKGNKKSLEGYGHTLNDLYQLLSDELLIQIPKGEDISYKLKILMSINKMRLACAPNTDTADFDYIRKYLNLLMQEKDRDDLNVQLYTLHAYWKQCVSYKKVITQKNKALGYVLETFLLWTEHSGHTPLKLPKLVLDEPDSVIGAIERDEKMTQEVLDYILQSVGIPIPAPIWEEDCISDAYFSGDIRITTNPFNVYQGETALLQRSVSLPTSLKEDSTFSKLWNSLGKPRIIFEDGRYMTEDRRVIAIDLNSIETVGSDKRADWQCSATLSALRQMFGELVPESKERLKQLLPEADCRCIDVYHFGLEVEDDSMTGMRGGWYFQHEGQHYLLNKDLWEDRILLATYEVAGEESMWTIKDLSTGYCRYSKDNVKEWSKLHPLLEKLAEVEPCTPWADENGNLVRFTTNFDSFHFKLDEADSFKLFSESYPGYFLIDVLYVMERLVDYHYSFTLENESGQKKMMVNGRWFDAGKSGLPFGNTVEENLFLLNHFLKTQDSTIFPHLQQLAHRCEKDDPLSEKEIKKLTEFVQCGNEWPHIRPEDKALNAEILIILLKDREMQPRHYDHIQLGIDSVYSTYIDVFRNIRSNMRLSMEKEYFLQRHAYSFRDPTKGILKKSISHTNILAKQPLTEPAFSWTANASDTPHDHLMSIRGSKNFDWDKGCSALFDELIAEDVRLSQATSSSSSCGEVDTKYDSTLLTELCSFIEAPTDEIAIKLYAAALMRYPKGDNNIRDSILSAILSSVVNIEPLRLWLKEQLDNSHAEKTVLENLKEIIMEESVTFLNYIELNDEATSPLASKKRDTHPKAVELLKQVGKHAALRAHSAPSHLRSWDHRMLPHLAKLPLSAHGTATASSSTTAADSALDDEEIKYEPLFPGLAETFFEQQTGASSSSAAVPSLENLQDHAVLRPSSRKLLDRLIEHYSMGTPSSAKWLWKDSRCVADLKAALEKTRSQDSEKLAKENDQLETIFNTVAPSGSEKSYLQLGCELKKYALLTDEEYFVSAEKILDWLAYHIGAGTIPEVLQEHFRKNLRLRLRIQITEKALEKLRYCKGDESGIELTSHENEALKLITSKRTIPLDLPEELYAILHYEGRHGLVLREKQIKMTYLRDAKPYVAIQAPSGMGKSDVLTPLWLSLSRQYRRQWIVIGPDALHETTGKRLKDLVSKTSCQTIPYFHFSREKAQKKEGRIRLERLKNSLRVIGRTSGPIKTRKADLQSLLLSHFDALLEMLHCREEKDLQLHYCLKVKKFESTLQAIMNNTRLLSDEVHEFFNPLVTLNYDYGTPTKVDRNRWQLGLVFLQILIDEKVPFDTLEVAVDSKLYQERFLPKIIDRLLSSQKRMFGLSARNPETLKKWLRFHEERVTPENEAAFNRWIEQYDQKTQDSILLVRGYLHVYLPQALKSKLGSQYGPVKETEFAKPYRGNNEPSTANFAQSDILILLTALMYLKKGISNRQMSGLIGVWKSYIAAKRLQSDSSSDTCDQAKMAEVMFGAPLSTIDETNEETLNRLVLDHGTEPSVIFSYLEHCLFPTLYESHSSLSASAHDVSMGMFNEMTGLAATLNNHALFSTSVEAHLDPHTDAEILSHLLNPEVCEVRTTSRGDLGIVLDNSEVMALVDPCDVLKGRSNESVAQEILAKRDDLSGVVIFDSTTKVPVIYREKDKKETYTESAFADENLFVYYDGTHCTGAHFPMNSHIKMAVLVDHDVTWTNYAQTLKRARKLGPGGQTAVLHLTPEASESLESLDLEDGDILKALLLNAVNNEGAQIESTLFVALKQMIRAAYRREFLFRFHREISKHRGIFANVARLKELQKFIAAHRDLLMDIKDQREHIDVGKVQAPKCASEEIAELIQQYQTKYDALDSGELDRRLAAIQTRADELLGTTARSPSSGEMFATIECEEQTRSENRELRGLQGLCKNPVVEVPFSLRSLLRRGIVPFLETKGSNTIQASGTGYGPLVTSPLCEILPDIGFTPRLRVSYGWMNTVKPLGHNFWGFSKETDTAKRSKEKLDFALKLLKPAKVIMEVSEQCIDGTTKTAWVLITQTAANTLRNELLRVTPEVRAKLPVNITLRWCNGKILSTLQEPSQNPELATILAQVAYLNSDDFMDKRLRPYFTQWLQTGNIESKKDFYCRLRAERQQILFESTPVYRCFLKAEDTRGAAASSSSSSSSSSSESSLEVRRSNRKVGRDEGGDSKAKEPIAKLRR